MRTSKTKIKSEKIFSSTYKNTTILVVFLFFAMFSVMSTTSAIECADGATSSGGVCGTDTADVHVSVEGGWAISVSSAGALGVDVSPAKSGVLSTVVDNVNVYTNIPTGYQLYLNTTSGSNDIYNASDIEKSQNHFTATTGTKDNPIALANNTWGYSLDTNPATFAKVALANEDTDSNIYTNPTKTSSSGDDIPVTYGFKVDTKLAPGTYSTQVTYTAVAGEVPIYKISSVSPISLQVSDQTNKTFTIMTTTPASELGLGDITAKITDGTNTVNLTNCKEVINNNYRGAQCTYNGNLPITVKGYNVELSSAWHNSTYTKSRAFYLYQGTMQSFTQANCNSLATSTASADYRIMLQDTRDSKVYAVSKLADGNCWMVQNLALDGGRTLTPSDSNVTTTKTIPASANLAENSVEASEFDIPQIYIWNQNKTTTDCGSYEYCVVSDAPYGNLYNWNAATATVGKLATTGIVYESICPKGWRLPDAGIGDTDKSYRKLSKAYGIGDGANIDEGQEYLEPIQKAPLNFPLAGGYNNGVRIVGQRGNYWTRVVNTVHADGDYADYFHFRVDDVYHFYANGANIKSRGFSVRCVFGN